MKEEREDHDNKTARFSAVVEGPVEDYRAVRDLVKIYRIAKGQVMAMRQMADFASADYDVKKKAVIKSSKGANKGKSVEEKSEEYARLVAKPDTAAAKEMLRIAGGADSLSPKGHDAYEVRPVIMRSIRRLLDGMGIREDIDSSFWDVVSHDAVSALRAKDAKIKAPVGLLNLTSTRELPSTSRVPMKIMRTLGENPRSYAELEWNDKDECRLRIEVLKGRVLTLLLKGKVDRDGKKFELSAEGNSRLLHSMATGKVAWLSPSVNFDDKSGRITVYIPFRHHEDDPVKKPPTKGKKFVIDFVPRSSRFHEKSRFKSPVPYQFLVHSMASTSGMKARGDSEKYQKHSIAADHVAFRLDRMRAEAERLGLESNSMAISHAGPMSAVRGRQEALAKKRHDFSNTVNHEWSSKLVGLARRWLCDGIKVYVKPDLTIKGRKFSHSWPWKSLVGMIEQKAKAKGLKVEVVGEPGGAVELFAGMDADAHKKEQEASKNEHGN